jgi:integrase
LAVGLRSGECSALRWPDVDLDAGAVTVRHTPQRKKGAGLILMPPKSEKSRRTVPLPEAVHLRVRARVIRQEQEHILGGSRWKDTGYAFTSSKGTPIDDRKILKEFNALCLAVKLPKQRFHDLRHACISQGVDAKVIAKSSGIPTYA